MQRELPKLPDLPDNFDALINDITEICFLKSDERAVDIVFVFGNWSQTAQIAATVERLYRNNISRHFILTGGAPTFDYRHLGDTAVADNVYAMLPADMIADCKIDIQNTSVDSVQDVQFSMEFLKPLENAKIGCVACSWAIGRQILYLQKHMPEAEILPLSYDALYQEQPLTRDNWHHHDEYRKRLWGEILRYKLYGERGDMAYSEELGQNINFIINNIN